MKILIIEDEQLAAEQIKDYLERYGDKFEVIDIIESVQEGVEWLQNHPAPDCILSDIRLTDGLSFDIFVKVEVTCPIIFTTAYDQYAIRAFELNSVGYLLKPFQPAKLFKCLEKAEKQLSNKPAPIDFDQLAAMMQSDHKEYKSRFLVRLGQKIKAIPVNDIAYFMSSDKLTYLVTQHHEKYPVDHSLEEIDEMLDPVYFFKLNRKFITHFDAIKEIHPHFKGRLKLILVPESKEEIIVSSERTPAFKSWLDH